MRATGNQIVLTLLAGLLSLPTGIALADGTDEASKYGFIAAEGRDLDWSRWAQHDPESEVAVDYRALARFFERYAADVETQGALDYLLLQKRAIGDLSTILHSLQQVPVSSLSRDEQLAFWLNLHNMEAIRLTAVSYPLKDESTRRLILGQKWRRPTLTVEGVELSLDDLERRIIPHQWQAANVLYGLYMPASGAATLPAKPYTGDTVRAVLKEQAAGFFASGRAYQFEDDELHVSAIYRWSPEIFPDDRAIIEHIRSHSDDDVDRRLAGVENIEAGFFNWRLNAYNSGYYLQQDRMGFGS